MEPRRNVLFVYDNDQIRLFFNGMSFIFWRKGIANMLNDSPNWVITFNFELFSEILKIVRA